MIHRVLPKWLAGALIAMLVLGAISASNTAQAAPALHPLTSPTSGQAQGNTAPDKAASSAQGQPRNGLLPGFNQTGKHVSPAASGISYQINTFNATPISGTTDIGNHCDDCLTAVNFPFPVTFYGTQYTAANASSNGNLQFNSNNNAYSNGCLPDSSFSDAIFLYWDDLTTSNPGTGIFTVLGGVAPHRHFVIEWRALQHDNSNPTDEEIIFYEDTTTFTVIYGNSTDRGISATTGVQEGDGSGSNSHTSYSCNAANLTLGLGLDYVPQGGPTPTPTNTPNPCAVDWSEQAVYPSAIVGEAVAVQGSNLYSFGGATLAGVTPLSYRYDGTSWHPIASLLAGRYQVSAVSDGTYIYILNGVDSNFDPTNTLYRYDPGTNTYSLLASPVYTTALQAAVYLGGKIYRIGGNNNITLLSSVEVYDIASDTWSTAANYPTPIANEAAVAIGGYIYTAGGATNPGLTLTNKTYRYNPATNLWEDGQIDDLPQPREASASGVFNGQFLVAGGGITGPGATTIVTDSALSWNPNGNVWTSLPNMVAPESLNAGGTLGNAFYSVGGSNQSSTNYNQRYAPNGCATSTPGAPTNTPGAATATPTDCPNPFVDVTGNVFYGAIHYLACRSVVNGTDATHYSPAGTSTRGQFAKVVVLGFGTPFYTPTTPDFTDVPAAYFAYLYIESGFHAGVLSGFDAASCTAAGQVPPCYLPGRAITRGQLTKLVVNAAGYALYTPSGGPDFTDVPASNIFYASIETAYNKGVVGGYPDHTFRPNNNIRRDEMAQIVFKGVTTP